MKPITKKRKCALTPALALEWLKKGNQRYAINSKFKRKILVQNNQPSGHQGPIAYILSCDDLQTPTEKIFDQNIGDIFSARAPGNTLNNEILASMEFACKIAGAKLVVVLGHNKCGAVRDTCDHIQMDSLTNLLVKIQPAFYCNFVDKVAAINVRRAVKSIQTRSPILREMIAGGQIGIIGGCYDSTSGKVDFFDDTLVIMQPSSILKTKKRKRTESTQPLMTVERRHTRRAYKPKLPLKRGLAE